jgi:hypothetical protein
MKRERGKRLHFLWKQFAKWSTRRSRIDAWNLEENEGFGHYLGEIVKWNGKWVILTYFITFYHFLLQIKLFFEYFTYALSLMNFAKCFYYRLKDLRMRSLTWIRHFWSFLCIFSHVHIVLGFFRKNSKHNINSFSGSWNHENTIE